MTCRHEYGDPECGSSDAASIRKYLTDKRILDRAGLAEAAKSFGATTELLDIERCGPNREHVIITVKMVGNALAPEVLCVYFDLTEIEIVRWRGGPPISFAPATPSTRAPAAIFPNTPTGRVDARAYIAARPHPKT